jgi:hypothetical protein
VGRRAVVDRGGAAHAADGQRLLETGHHAELRDAALEPGHPALEPDEAVGIPAGLLGERRVLAAQRVQLRHLPAEPGVVDEQPAEGEHDCRRRAHDGADEPDRDTDLAECRAGIRNEDERVVRLGHSHISRGDWRQSADQRGAGCAETEKLSAEQRLVAFGRRRDAAAPSCLVSENVPRGEGAGGDSRAALRRWRGVPCLPLARMRPAARALGQNEPLPLAPDGPSPPADPADSVPARGRPPCPWRRLTRPHHGRDVDSCGSVRADRG